MFNKRAILEGRVERGANWLDGHFGRRGWLPNIESERLDLKDGNTCMVGQLFPQTANTLKSNFVAMYQAKLMPTEMFTKRGFLLPEKAFWPWTPTSEDYAMLTDVWLDKMARLKAVSPAISPVQQKDLKELKVKAKGKR